MVKNKGILIVVSFSHYYSKSLTIFVTTNKRKKGKFVVYKKINRKNLHFWSKVVHFSCLDSDSVQCYH